MGLRGGVVSSGADHHEYTPVARWAVSPVMKTTMIASDGDRVVSRYLRSSDLLSPIQLQWSCSLWAMSSRSGKTILDNGSLGCSR
jgi:hypothetical protein